MATIMDQKSKYLIGKWSKRIAMVEKCQGKALTYEKKVALSHALENQQDRIKCFEATNGSNVGPFKRYALDISL